MLTIETKSGIKLNSICTLAIFYV